MAGVRRATLIQLAASLARPGMAERGLAPLRIAGSGGAGGAGRARGADRIGALKYFDPVPRCRVCAALARTLSELRLAGDQRGRGGLDDGAAGAIWRLLLDPVPAGIAARSLADLAMHFRAGGRVRREAMGLPLLLLDAPLETRAHREFFARLAAGAPAVLAAVLRGDVSGRFRGGLRLGRGSGYGWSLNSRSNICGVLCFPQTPAASPITRTVRNVFGARRGTGGGRDRAADSGAGGSRQAKTAAGDRLRPDGDSAAQPGAVSTDDGRRAAAGAHSGVFQPGHGAARSGGTRVSGAARMRGGELLGVALRGVFVVGASSGGWSEPRRNGFRRTMRCCRAEPRRRSGSRASHEARGDARAGGLGKAAGGRRGDRRARSLGSAAARAGARVRAAAGRRWRARTTTRRAAI